MRVVVWERGNPKPHEFVHVGVALHREGQEELELQIINPDTGDFISTWGVDLLDHFYFVEG
jgi:hypothetical protein